MTKNEAVRTKATNMKMGEEERIGTMKRDKERVEGGKGQQNEKWKVWMKGRGMQNEGN